MKIPFDARALFSAMITLPFLVSCNTPQPDTRPDAAMANPASQYCLSQGGTLDIVSDASGDRGMCHLPDGTIIDEWELFRRGELQK